ncbi:G-protein coupled receptor 55a [Esox lucius]|uniref:G-protein coupled receptors family 1 profile domain-containing protein n=1 Tax=Esox lucius TaxID=8010 RepID=A0AAY5KIV9_ESOLU|nr:G-protein coupled receptor 55a [Esox lucius]
MDTSISNTSDPVRVIQWIIYIPTLVVGFPLNLAALYLLLFRICRWTESTVYLTSLIVNDILLLFSLPFKMYAYQNLWGLSMGFCSFLESLVFVNIYGSIVFIVCISADRYISLQFPFSKGLRSPRKATLVCLAVWLIIFAFTPPVYDLHKKENNTSSGNANETRCFQQFSNNTWQKTWIIVTLESVFMISTVSIVFFSVRVMQILRQLRRRNPLDEKLRDNKSVKIVLTNLVAFLVCFIPYHVAAFVYFLAKNYKEDTEIFHLRQFVHISSTVGSVNCLTDGFCYYLVLKESLLNVQRERGRMSSANMVTTSKRERGTGVDGHTGGKGSIGLAR